MKELQNGSGYEMLVTMIDKSIMNHISPVAR